MGVFNSTPKSPKITRCSSYTLYPPPPPRPLRFDQARDAKDRAYAAMRAGVSAEEFRKILVENGDLVWALYGFRKWTLVHLAVDDHQIELLEVCQKASVSAFISQFSSGFI